MHTKSRPSFSSTRKILVLFISLSMMACKEATEKQETTSQTDSVSQKDTQNKKPQDQYRVVPGKQMGDFVLDEDAGPIVDSLPEPDVSDAAMGKVLLKWEDIAGDSLFMFNTQKMGVEDFKRLKTVRSLSAKFRTKQGLGVDSKRAEIEDEFSLEKAGTFPENNGVIDTLYATSKGIGFEIGKDGICRGVMVFLPQDSAPSPYIPLYEGFEEE